MPTVSLKASENRLLREDIVDAAEKLFFSRGYDNITLDEIADEAGVEKTTILRIFKSKEAVLLAVALRGACILHEMHEICSKIDADGLMRLHAMSNGYYDFAKKYPDYFRLLCIAGEERFLTRDNEDALTLRSLLTANLEMAVGALEAGKTDGSVREDLDSAEAAIYMGILQTAVLNPGAGWKLMAGEIGSERLEAGLRHFIGHAIAGPYAYPDQRKSGRHGIVFPWGKAKRSVK